MTVVALTVQQIARPGLAPSYGAANAGGNSIANDGRVFQHVKNGSGVSINVTVDVPIDVDGLNVPDLVVAVPAGGERMIGPFLPMYNQSDGTVLINYSAVATVTVAAFRL